MRRLNSEALRWFPALHSDEVASLRRPSSDGSTSSPRRLRGVDVSVTTVSSTQQPFLELGQGELLVPADGAGPALLITPLEAAGSVAGAEGLVTVAEAPSSSSAPPVFGSTVEAIVDLVYLPDTASDHSQPAHATSSWPPSFFPFPMPVRVNGVPVPLVAGEPVYATAMRAVALAFPQATVLRSAGSGSDAGGGSGRHSFDLTTPFGWSIHVEVEMPLEAGEEDTSAVSEDGAESLLAQAAVIVPRADARKPANLFSSSGHALAWRALKPLQPLVRPAVPTTSTSSESPFGRLWVTAGVSEVQLQRAATAAGAPPSAVAPRDRTAEGDSSSSNSNSGSDDSAGSDSPDEELPGPLIHHRSHTQAQAQQQHPQVARPAHALPPPPPPQPQPHPIAPAAAPVWLSPFSTQFSATTADSGSSFDRSLKADAPEFAPPASFGLQLQAPPYEQLVASDQLGLQALAPAPAVPSFLAALRAIVPASAQHAAPLTPELEQVAIIRERLTEVSSLLATAAAAVTANNASPGNSPLPFPFYEVGPVAEQMLKLAGVQRITLRLPPMHNSPPDAGSSGEAAARAGGVIGAANGTTSAPDSDASGEDVQPTSSSSAPQGPTVPASEVFTQLYRDLVVSVTKLHESLSVLKRETFHDKNMKATASSAPHEPGAAPRPVLHPRVPHNLYSNAVASRFGPPPDVPPDSPMAIKARYTAVRRAFLDAGVVPLCLVVFEVLPFLPMPFTGILEEATAVNRQMGCCLEVSIQCLTNIAFDVAVQRQITALPKVSKPLFAILLRKLEACLNSDAGSGGAGHGEAGGSSTDAHGESGNEPGHPSYEVSVAAARDDNSDAGSDSDDGFGVVNAAEICIKVCRFLWTMCHDNNYAAAKTIIELNGIELVGVGLSRHYAHENGFAAAKYLELLVSLYGLSARVPPGTSSTQPVDYPISPALRGALDVNVSAGVDKCLSCFSGPKFARDNKADKVRSLASQVAGMHRSALAKWQGEATNPDDMEPGFRGGAAPGVGVGLTSTTAGFDYHPFKGRVEAAPPSAVPVPASASGPSASPGPSAGFSRGDVRAEPYGAPAGGGPGGMRSAPAPHFHPAGAGAPMRGYGGGGGFVPPQPQFPPHQQYGGGGGGGAGAPVPPGYGHSQQYYHQQQHAQQHYQHPHGGMGGGMAGGMGGGPPVSPGMMGGGYGPQHDGTGGHPPSFPPHGQRYPGPAGPGGRGPPGYY